MSTINRIIAGDIIHTNKYAEDNPTKIVTYRNMFNNGLEYAVCFIRDNQNKYERSPACSDVKTVWTKQGGLTDYGKQLFTANHQ